MAPGVVADGRQPSELHGEELHQHHAERERGKRDARYRERHAEPVGPAIAPYRRHDADRHADQHRPQHAPHGQPERRHEAVADLLRNRPLGANGSAEIPVQHAVDEAQELLRQRPVEPEILAHELDGFEVGVRPGCKPRRIARQQMDEQKDEKADQQQRRQQAEQALDDVGRHRRTVRPPFTSGRSP